MKFSIRELLLITVIWALALGWTMDCTGRTELKKRTAAEIEKAERVQGDLYHAERQLALHRQAVESLKAANDELRKRLPELRGHGKH